MEDGTDMSQSAHNKNRDRLDLICVGDRLTLVADILPDPTDPMFSQLFGADILVTQVDPWAVDVDAHGPRLVPGINHMSIPRGKYLAGQRYFRIER